MVKSLIDKFLPHQANIYAYNCDYWYIVHCNEIESGLKNLSNHLKKLGYIMGRDSEILDYVDSTGDIEYILLYEAYDKRDYLKHVYEEKNKIKTLC